MALITLRAVKGAPLTIAEVDANFNNINLELTTDLDAGALARGIVPVARLSGSYSINSLTATTLATARTIALSGAATGTATSFNGSDNISIPVTALNASNLATGTIPDARFPALLPSIDGSNLNALNANALASGTVPVARLSGSYSINSLTATTLATARTIALSGAATGTATSFNGGANISIAVTALNADQLSAGTVATARLSGTYPISITGSASGNAGTATTLQTARSLTIGDKLNSFNGSANIAWTRLEIGVPRTTTTTSVGAENTESCVAYVQNPLFGVADGGLYSHVYSEVWKHQIQGDYRTGQIAIRGKNNGTWTAWRTVVDSSNFTDYTVTKTGGGASGTWGISITGSASSATNATNATTATNQSGGTINASSGSIGSLSYTSLSGGRIVANSAGNAYNQASLEITGNGGTNTIYPTLGFHQPTLYAATLQLRADKEFSFRDINGSGLANLTVQNFTAAGSITAGAISGGSLSTSGSINSTAASLSFLNGGNALPISTNNLLVSNNYSDRSSVPANGIFARGAITSADNITAYSDEKLKKDWTKHSNLVEKLAQVKNGTYTRIDTDERQTGVSAQSLREILPEAVMDNDGTLSVAYGNAALTACVELAKEVMKLREEIEKLRNDN